MKARMPEFTSMSKKLRVEQRRMSNAFVPLLPLSSSLLITNPCLSTTRTRHAHISVRTARRARFTMIGPFFPDFSDSKLMKSEIVRKEMGSLERDYKDLATVGTRYESFDPQGKHIFVDSALDVVDRFAIFLTRLRLSEEFSAQLFIKQYSVRLQQYGLTIESLIENTKKSLEMMRDDIPKV